MKHDFIFIGSSHTGLKLFLSSNYFHIFKVICIRERLTSELNKLCLLNNVELILVDSIKNFRDIIESNRKKQFDYIIYQLDMLIPEDLAIKYNFYNIHRGSLKNNRGPTPEVWSIIMGDTSTCISLHKINERIDSGILIKSYDVRIDPSDSVSSIRKKMEEKLPLLYECLNNFLMGKLSGESILDGVYRPWITEHDFTLDIENDSLEKIQRKIQSQRGYNGAIIFFEGRRYYITDLIEVGPANKTINSSIKIEENIISVQTKNKLYRFKINTLPLFSPPPIKAVSKRV